MVHTSQHLIDCVKDDLIVDWWNHKIGLITFTSHEVRPNYKINLEVWLNYKIILWSCNTITKGSLPLVRWRWLLNSNRFMQWKFRNTHHPFHFPSYQSAPTLLQNTCFGHQILRLYNQSNFLEFPLVLPPLFGFVYNKVFTWKFQNMNKIVFK